MYLRNKVRGTCVTYTQQRTFPTTTFNVAANSVLRTEAYHKCVKHHIEAGCGPHAMEVGAVLLKAVAPESALIIETKD